MKKNSLICVTSILLIKQTGLAQIQSALPTDHRNKIQRVNISQRFFKNSSTGLDIDPNSLDSVLKSLKTKSIYADENSEIQTHQEENFIDLSCFNCIVVNIDSKQSIESAKNERDKEK